MRKVFVFVALIALPWSSLAREQEETRVLQAQECPALFGDDEDRAFNAEERESCLDSVQVADYTINLLHHGDWTEPTPISLTGLELEDIDCPEGLDGEDQKCEPVAHLRLTEDMDGVDCPVGLYSLRVDDSLGEEGRLIAILPDLLLIELQGTLHYLPMDPMQKPVWRVIWRSPWKIMRLPGQKASSGSSHRRNTQRNKRRHKRR